MVFEGTHEASRSGEAAARGRRADPAAGGDGVGDALVQGPRGFFGLAAEAARADFDPATRWVEFVEALWEQVEAGFGLTADTDEYPQIPRAWFDHADDPAVVLWDAEPDGG